jgi:hypothetical protein
MKILTPFEKISRPTKFMLVGAWLLFVVLIWIIGTSGKEHLFPSPGQVFNGLSELYNEGLVIHIFNSLKLCFISIFFAIIISLLFAYSWPIPLMKPVAEFITKFRFLPFTGLSFYIAMLIQDARNMQVWILVVRTINEN